MRRSIIGKTILLAALAAMLLAACSGTVDTVAETGVGNVTTSAGPDETTAPTLAPPVTAAGTTGAPVTTRTAALPEFVIEGGVVSGPDRLEVGLGDTVEFVVLADAIDEVHVHGYDVYADVGPDEPKTVSFTADIPGIFEIELEGSHALLVELVVQQ